MAQEKGIPSCFQKKIAESKDYLGLYLAQIEGDTLYYLETPPLPGADRINVSTFYDEDCNEVNKSTTGGITGRPKGYKPYKLIETFWEKEIFPMKSFSQKKQKFEYLSSYNLVSPFKFSDHQSFYFSFKDGLQLLDKGKVTKTYKIIPKKLVHYSPYSGNNEPTENQLANASIGRFLSERSYNSLSSTVKQLRSLAKETVTVALEFHHHSVPFFYETQVQYSIYTNMFTLHLTAIRFKKFTPETDTPSKSRAEQRDYVERQIQKVHTYLCRPENYQRVTLDFLSREFFINKEILKTKFKEMYHDTVYNFHLRMRIEQSRLLVTSTKKPLKEIAATTGFNCYASFHRTFVKHHHVSPKILRKRMQRKE